MPKPGGGNILFEPVGEFKQKERAQSTNTRSPTLKHIYLFEIEH